MAHFHNNALIGASGQGGYQIERSLRFNSADSAYLNRTPASAGNRKTWTWSGWVKRSGLGTTQRLFNAYSGDENNTTEVGFNSSNQIDFSNVISGTQGNGFFGTTSAVFRDTSAWYHIVYAIDTTQSTAAAALKVYVNGVQQTLGASSYGGGANHNTFVNNTNVHRIGQTAPPNSGYFNGYLTEIHFIDGQALTPSSFGETDTITGVWKPKRYSGTYGTNGFKLTFSDNSGTTSTTLGKDSSGNGNNWTPNNFSVTAGAGNDSLIDTPTPYADGGNGRGNYPTWNPLDRTAATYSNGNLDVASTSAASPYNMASTMRFPATGKWYAEVTLTGLGAGSPGIGIGKNNSDAYAIYRITGAYLTSGMGASTSGTPNTYTTNDVIGIAYDAGAGTLEFYKNGVDQAGNITGITASTEWAIVFRADSASGDAATLNCGQRPFAYTPPSGFKALNTQNLPEPSIKKPNSYFDTLLWAGNNANPRTLGGLNFSPDFVWVKDRTQAANHRLVDAVRGGNKTLKSNTTDAETSSESLGTVSAFTSDGFTLAGTSAMDGVNLTGDSYVAWCWDESATPGFDIVSFASGTAGDKTFAHSLGVAPSFMIVKSRDESTYNWGIYHSTVCTNQQFFRFTTDARVSPGYNVWGTAIPTSSVFGVSVSDSQGIIKTNQNCIAYLWSEVAGFSKFGSYSGTGSSDGPFVFLGFRPKFVMFKRSDSTGSWFLEDSARGTYNVMGPELYANLSDAESTVNRLDFLSNGFKLRAANPGDNASGGTYIYAAFAETPFRYSLAR